MDFQFRPDCSAILPSRPIYFAVEISYEVTFYRDIAPFHLPISVRDNSSPSRIRTKLSASTFAERPFYAYRLQRAFSSPPIRDTESDSIPDWISTSWVDLGY